jgi:hypothetical protein
MLVTLLASGNSVSKLAEIDKLAANPLLETLNVSGVALVGSWQGLGGTSVTMFLLLLLVITIAVLAIITASGGLGALYLLCP